MTRLFDIDPIAELWPIFCIPTRLQGEIEGCAWFALPNWNERMTELDFIMSDDVEEIRTWWSIEQNTDSIGMGDTPNEALHDLIAKFFPEEAAMEIEEPDEEAEIHKSMDDAIALVTANTLGSQENNTQLFSQMDKIMEDWESSPSGVDPVIFSLIGLASRFAALAATEMGEDPGDFLRAYALNWNLRSIPSE